MDALRLLTRSTNLRPNQAKTANSTPLPSEGNQELPSEQINPKKRKRADEEKPQDLSPEEVREIQSKHKIRIVDLRLLRKTSKKRTKKQQKEYARVFPQPLTSFELLKSQCQVCEAIQRNVRAQAYYEPSEVQTAALPVLLSDPENAPDLLTVAPTGSGKTLAFLVPTIEKIRREHKSSSERHTRAIILAPTKELVGQIVNEGRKLCANTGVTITAARKGMKLAESTEEFEGEDEAHEYDSDNDNDGRNGDDHEQSSAAAVIKTDILVSTPLTLVHALGSSPLAKITTLILDEADVLLDPLFREQTQSIWTACTSTLLRVSLWSATLGSNVEELAISIIADRRKALSIKDKAPLYRIVIGLKDSSLPHITHKLIYAATEPGKLLGLRQLLRPSRPLPTNNSTTPTQQLANIRPPFLVFAQTIDRSTALFTELHIMQRFRAGQIWVLITTDLLSRGVDFRGVNAVVNYDIPTTSASYIHRAGRTGRAGREGGVCVTFYTREDVKYLKAIASVIKSSTTTSGTKSSSTAEVEGIPAWLLQSLPDLTKNTRKELKQRGVETRRAIKESDDADERRRKRKARIGTKSGYEKREENNRRGMVIGSKKRKEREMAVGKSVEDESFEGFD
ncbi:ATP-dependent RNA helicase ROK1 [Cyphellophora attinorum]|uniref:ATP-dependent RNA helicase n=1 Tax=Cyphellophora attinorum TaxID=1664694 RepID=A0A0N1HDP9_9EURO|nr:ATP-dependent RNA helicase ROK1 [Phialophora attinorum]KPI42662.1 ATP-dependent RNA helicase ROK1 [Phialophora attinorum]